MAKEIIVMSLIMFAGLGIQIFLIWLTHKQFNSYKAVQDIKEDLRELRDYIREQNNNQR